MYLRSYHISLPEISRIITSCVIAMMQRGLPHFAHNDHLDYVKLSSLYTQKAAEF